MPRALSLGGTGLVGRATARHLVAAGWEVDVTGRDPARLADDGGRFIAADRHDGAALRAALGEGADLLVDCIAYTAAQARLLLPLLPHVNSTVLISSKAVYVDAAGNHSNSDVAPDFGGPIPETQPTMAPRDIDFNSREGYGANKVAAEQVLLASGAPVTVLRPSKIHGEGAAPPREWVFVKRVLDRRPAVFLARQGTGADHTTAAANIAALIEVVASKPGARILNCGDPTPPNGREIAQVVAKHLGHAWEEVLIEDDSLGDHPWNLEHPVVLEMSAATELGYVPAGDYPSTVAAEIDWLVDERPPIDDEYFARYLDYAAEDRYLAAR